MRVAVVLGTRPEIIKLSPIIRVFERRGIDYFILHTGQHYSYNMDRIFFEQLVLPPPKYNLAVGSGSHGEITGKMLAGIEKILLTDKPDVALVEGDTNTVLAGALAATKLMIKVAHVEAGLRSYDREMPEEINRILTDHISDYLFAPTQEAKHILLGEGIKSENIFVTGNTIVDAILQNLKFSENIDVPFEYHQNRRYFLATIHRQENVDQQNRLEKIMLGLGNVAKEFNTQIIFPIHPRTRIKITSYGIAVEPLITLVDPMDYLTFLKVMKHSSMIFTDSGGVQEEACILHIPCVTLRYNTDRPETITVGANILAGVEPHSILQRAREMESKKDWINPLGDGSAAEKIVDVLSPQRLKAVKEVIPS